MGVYCLECKLMSQLNWLKNEEELLQKNKYQNNMKVMDVSFI